MTVIDLIQAGATPMLAIVIFLQMRTDARIHDIDKRVVRIETQLGVLKNENSAG